MLGTISTLAIARCPLVARTTMGVVVPLLTIDSIMFCNKYTHSVSIETIITEDCPRTSPDALFAVA